VRDLVNDAGTVLNHKVYDSFGRLASETSAAEADDIIFGWTGREFDGETGLQYNRARYYDPETGRFISTDPSGIELSGDYNLYRYAGNNPLNATDPTGLASRVLGQAANAAASALSGLAASIFAGPAAGASVATAAYQQGWGSQAYASASGAWNTASNWVSGTQSTVSQSTFGGSSLRPDFSWMGPNLGLSDSTIRSIHAAQAEIASQGPVRSYQLGGLWTDYDAAVAAGEREPSWFEQHVGVPLAKTLLPPVEPSTVHVYADGTERVLLRGLPSSGDMWGQAALIGGLGSAARQGIRAFSSELVSEGVQTGVQSSTGIYLPIPAISHRTNAVASPNLSVSPATVATDFPVGTSTPVKINSQRTLALLPSKGGEGPLRWQIVARRTLAGTPVHGNNLQATGDHVVYAVTDRSSGQVLRFGETGRDVSVRGSEWRRFFARQGIDVDIQPLRTVEGKAAARQIETKYITTFERLFGHRPEFNLSDH
jgi:RHS repeat-associated protein